MIDGLMDSLVLDKLPSRQSLRQTLAELCRGAENIDPVLHSFKNDQQLRVGVRDLLGKEDVQATTGRCRTLPRPVWRRSPRRNTSAWPPSSASRESPPDPRRTALRDGHSGHGQVWRPGDELPQRLGHRLPVRGRGADGLRIRPQPGIRHDQPALLQRTRPADHQDDQPLERLWKAV